MYGRAGADALDDLLPEVAALVEVEGAGLVDLLRQIALGDIDAVKRRAFEDAQGLDGGEAGGRGVCLREDAPCFGDIAGGQP